MQGNTNTLNTILLKQFVVLLMPHSVYVVVTDGCNVTWVCVVSAFIEYVVAPIKLRLVDSPLQIVVLPLT